MTELFLTKQDTQDTGKERLLKAYAGLKAGSYLVRMERAGKRSGQQNKYLHGYLIPAVFNGLKDAGFDEVRTYGDAKLIIKATFLKKDIVNINTGEVITVIRDTHDLTKEEMNILFEDVIRWSAEYLGCQLHYPNEQLTIV